MRVVTEVRPGKPAYLNLIPSKLKQTSLMEIQQLMILGLMMMVGSTSILLTGSRNFCVYWHKLACADGYLTIIFLVILFFLNSFLFFGVLMFQFEPYY